MRLLRPPLFRLIAIGALQVLILLSILAFKQYTVWTSETILLRLDTTDPQDLVGRESAPARYEISRVDTSELPGDDDFYMTIFVELRKGEDGMWEPVALHDDRNRSLDGTVLIETDHWDANGAFEEAIYDLRYGIENVYISEGTPGLPAGPGHVVALEVRVDRFGEPSPGRFLIDGQPFDLKRD